jgi:hypothetical protein
VLCLYFTFLDHKMDKEVLWIKKEPNTKSAREF